MQIITGIERRRRWSAAGKLRIVPETEQPGAGIPEIARRYEIGRGLLWNWLSRVGRGLLRPDPPAVFVPVHVVSERPPHGRRGHADPVPIEEHRAHDREPTRVVLNRRKCHVGRSWVPPRWMNDGSIDTSFVHQDDGLLRGKGCYFL
jgi:transposase-like protein